MPRAQVHDQKKSRNYAVMGALLAFVATVFFVTIIRMTGG